MFAAGGCWHQTLRLSAIRVTDNSTQEAPFRMPGYDMKLTNKNTFQHRRSIKCRKYESDLGIDKQIGVSGSLEISVSGWRTYSVAIGVNTASASCVRGKIIALVDIADDTGIGRQHIAKKRTVKSFHTTSARLLAS